MSSGGTSGLQQLDRSTFVSGGKALEVGRYGFAHDAPAIVLLHEALGSVSHWRDFPIRLGEAANCNTLTYSRAGHGESEGPVEARGLEYLQRQASVVLHGVLKQARIERPVLFGHSEGAAIAMFYAAAHPAFPRALILESPVVTVEPATIVGLERARHAYQTTDLRQRLERYHRDPDGVFQAFSDPWLSRHTASNDFREHLRAISCPTLILQGDRDEYATAEQTRVLSECLPNAQVAVIPNCGHSPHREQPELVIRHVCEFLLSVWLGDLEIC